VFGEINFVKEVILWSDKCSVKDMQKLEADYGRDLVKGRFSSKAILANYIKDTGKVAETGDEQTENEEDEKPKESEINCESTISLNPKLNISISPGFAKQIEKNINLIEFKLVYYRLHPQAWRQIGQALGKSKNLLIFTVQACNLDSGENIQMLFKGLTHNQSLRTLDFSDCNLTDAHGDIILAYIKKQAERRDNDLWEMSLRMNEAESHLKMQTRVLNMSYINESKTGDCDRELDS